MDNCCTAQLIKSYSFDKNFPKRIILFLSCGHSVTIRAKMKPVPLLSPQPAEATKERRFFHVRKCLSSEGKPHRCKDRDARIDAVIALIFHEQEECGEGKDLKDHAAHRDVGILLKDREHPFGADGRKEDL